MSTRQAPRKRTTQKSVHPASRKSAPTRRQLALRCLRGVQRLQRDAVALEQAFAGVIRHTAEARRDSVRNLLHYLAVRQRDIRPLQNDLAALGLSSLGRMEAHVLASLEAVLDALRHLCGLRQPATAAAPRPPCTYAEGNEKLQRHAAAILGPNPADRRSRIMVTMPGEAASDAGHIRDLLAQGMNIMRINCAHDDASTWTAMVRHLRAAQKTLGLPCLVSFDLAGPKLRTGPVQAGPSVIRWRPRRNKLGQVMTPARVRFGPAGVQGQPGETVVTLAGDLCAAAQTGDRVRLVDTRGKQRSLEVIEAEGSSLLCETARTAYIVPGTRVRLYRGKHEIAHAEAAPMPALPEAILLRPGNMLDIVPGEEIGRPAQVDAQGRTLAHARISCALPQVFRCVQPGERIFIDDGKIAGIIRRASRRGICVEITSAVGGVGKLRGEKGINLPDTDLHLPALTDKDRADLDVVARLADIVALSFVQRPSDVRALLAELEMRKATHLGVMLKIETRQAFHWLPALLIYAMRHPALAVMVARGDLGVEVGFERLSEVQEEMLWLCEAAHVPVVWATQVLESLAKGGMPSRAEVTDAAMGSRAECVMLNKGPYILETLQFLHDVLGRMQAHQSKKMPLLRRLQVSDLRHADEKPVRPAGARKGAAVRTGKRGHAVLAKAGAKIGVKVSATAPAKPRR